MWLCGSLFITAQRLAPLDSLTVKARERMRETALACVRHGGNSVEMAASLILTLALS